MSSKKYPMQNVYKHSAVDHTVNETLGMKKVKRRVYTFTASTLWYTLKHIIYLNYGLGCVTFSAVFLVMLVSCKFYKWLWYVVSGAILFCC